MLLFLFGLFCLFLVIGLFTENPVMFAVWGIVILAALCFVVFILLMVGALAH